MRYLAVFLLCVMAACEQPTAPEALPPPGPPGPPDVLLDPLTGDSLVVSRPGRLGDGSLGDLAFRTSCGPCHASRDGFDLAFFNFSDHDVIRRGLDHVDTTTVLAIRDYIRSLRPRMTTVDRQTELFRPARDRLADDVAFAVRLFGRDAWPRTLTIEELHGVDPRDVALAVPFPTWSSEADESDWMPEAPLPAAVLDAEGGLVRDRLIAYDDERSDAALRVLVEAFERITTAVGAVCEGGPGFHPHPVPCLEARRWLASLTAMHLLAHGRTRSVPEYIADQWWRVGEAAVSWSLRPGTREERLQRRHVATSWLMLSWVYDPARVGDNAAYLSEFTKHTDERRQGALAYAYWMTLDPTARDGAQPYDLMLQMLVRERLPTHWYADYAHWTLDVINGFLDEGIRPTTEAALAEALEVVRLSMQHVREHTTSEQFALQERLRALDERLQALR